MQLQLRPPAPLQRHAGTLHGRHALHARRGTLCDTRGRVLAATHLGTRLFADPGLIDDLPRFAERVADLLDYDEAEIVRMVDARRDGRYVVLDPDLTAWRIAELASHRVPGLGTERFAARHYPHRSRAGQLLGVVGTDGVGREGIEFALNRELSADAGSIRFLRDAANRPLSIEAGGFKPPADGRDVQVSIDLVIQSLAEVELERQCLRYGADAGQLIVMEPATGRVLAMANYPFFDPAELLTTPRDRRRNRCVTDAFEPGSVFKPFVWAAALEGGFAVGDEMIDCTESGVYRSPKGRRLRDAHAHGMLTWEQVLVKSSNIGMAIVAQRMGIDHLDRAVRRFGFGQRSGIGLPGEASGIVHPARKWTHYSVTSVPMGQEIAATGLQLVRALAAIANDGMMPAASIRCAGEFGTEIIYEPVLSPEAARYTRYVMRRVVTEGTGRRARSERYSIFGKTGTAQVPNPKGGGYLPEQYTSSFIGGAPVEQPRLVAGCFVHRPDKSKGHYGGIVAAPAILRVIEQSLEYLGVAPDVETAAPLDGAGLSRRHGGTEEQETRGTPAAQRSDGRETL